MANIQLTQELVKYLFDYKDGMIFWKNKISNFSRITLGNRAGYYHKGTNRNCITLYGKEYKTARIIFLWHKGYLPEIVDHENIDQLDDRIENLRAASKGQNNANKHSQKNSTSKYLGVSWRHRKDRPNGAWIAQIQIPSRYKHIGQFKNEHEAALAYNREAVRYHKEFANLNIIQL